MYLRVTVAFVIEAETSSVPPLTGGAEHVATAAAEAVYELLPDEAKTSGRSCLLEEGRTLRVRPYRRVRP